MNVAPTLLRPPTPQALADAATIRRTHGGTRCAEAKALALEAGFADEIATCLALDPRIVDTASAHAVVHEAREMFALCALACRSCSQLAVEFDMHEVARRMVMGRLPMSEVRRELVDKIASYDQHIDTAPPMRRASRSSNAEMDAVAEQAWSKRRGGGQ